MRQMQLDAFSSDAQAIVREPQQSCGYRFVFCRFSSDAKVRPRRRLQRPRLRSTKRTTRKSKKSWTWLPKINGRRPRPRRLYCISGSEKSHGGTGQYVGDPGRPKAPGAGLNKIRDIDTENSVFAPTIRSLLTEKKDRGLPASKDVRDTVHRIENTPYIPETYGKTDYQKGPLFDFESTKGQMSKVLEKEVNIHLDNIPLETVLVNLSQSAGVNIVADKSLPALKQELSINLDKVNSASSSVMLPQLRTAISGR